MKINKKSPAASGLYIHIPFCKSKCPYCDFASYTGCEEAEEAYIDSVIKEAANYHGENVDSVFIGGGTPSCIKSGLLSKLIYGISKHIYIEESCEFTVEANPNSFTRETAGEYRSIGCNRVSFGLQSASNSLLKKIGRIHTSEDFAAAFENAFFAGITNINADLMYSLPWQNMQDISDTLKYILKFPINHVSAYALKIEEDTPFFEQLEKGLIKLPDEETDRAMFREILEALREAGLFRYEISNFAKPGFECRHNLKYWERKEYIGLGASAHSFFGGRRFANSPLIGEYINGINNKSSAVCFVDEDDAPEFEELMLFTRIKKGVDLKLFKKPSAAKYIEKLRQNALAEIINGRLVLTDSGMDVQDSIVIDLSDYI